MPVRRRSQEPRPQASFHLSTKVMTVEVRTEPLGSSTLAEAGAENGNGRE